MLDLDNHTERYIEQTQYHLGKTVPACETKYVLCWQAEQAKLHSLMMTRTMKERDSNTIPFS